jgi:pimeloyl-ACP methyl ester carboxylesterase
MHFLNTLLMILLVALALLALFTFLVARRVDAAFPAPGQWIEVEGERLHYRALGQGPAIVLVHGLAGESRNFDYLPLQELAREFRLVLVDRPGSGHSPRVDEGKAGIAAQGRILAAFIRALQFQHPPLLVGHSLGGAISLAVALQDPDCIAGLGLIAPATHFTPHVPGPFRAMAIRVPWIRRLFAHTLAAPLAILNTRAVLAALFGPDEAPKSRGGFRSLLPPSFVGASTDMAAVEQDLPAQQRRYGELRLPVSILYGEGDRILDWREQGEALRAKVPQARLRVIPGGHMLPVTQASATAAWLRETARATLGDLCNSSGQ